MGGLSTLFPLVGFLGGWLVSKVYQTRRKDGLLYPVSVQQTNEE